MRLGLKPGDVILAVNGRNVVKDRGSAERTR
jgi:S1-C subfamily serine protease